MKRFFALLAALCLLAGCAAGADNEAPVWQTELTDGGTLSISGGTVREETTDFMYTASDVLASLPFLHISGKNAPTLTLTGVEENTVALIFIEPVGENRWIHYLTCEPLEKLDYVVTRDSDGTLRYRLDTACRYGLLAGGEWFMLDITREDL